VFKDYRSRLITNRKPERDAGCEAVIITSVVLQSKGWERKPDGARQVDTVSTLFNFGRHITCHYY
jgi:hypothetical protein